MWAHMDDEVKNSYGEEFFNDVMKMQQITVTSGVSFIHLYSHKEIGV